MKHLLILLLLVAACLGTEWVTPAEKHITSNSAAPFAVVELFTSQGCSSCPPADALLKKINNEAQRSGKNIYVLSFHVDYWNYIGWKDPFSSKAFSDRQRQYAAAFRSRRIYTPQAIVNGKQDVVGSQEGALRQLIESELRATPETAIRLENPGNSGMGEISLKYSITSAPAGGEVNVALVEDDLSSNVTRGENTGRHLEHTNVVRQFKTVQLKPGDSEGSATFALDSEYVRKNLRVIAYVQDRGTMHVLAATSLPVG